MKLKRKIWILGIFLSASIFLSPAMLLASEGTRDSPFSIIFALIGGGGMGALLTHALSRYREFTNEFKNRKAVVHLIENEISTLWEEYDNTVGVNLMKLENGKYFEQPYSLSQEYFQVFHSNANILGKLKDDTLGEEIFRAYTKFKVLLDTFYVNNQFLRVYIELAGRVAANPSDVYFNSQEQRYKGWLIGMLGKLQKRHKETQSAVQSAITNIQTSLQDADLWTCRSKI